MTLFEEAPVIRVALGWMTHRHDCTLRGITERCHGGCCYARGGTYWPARVDPGPDGACAALGPTGCRLGADRPLCCKLYPLTMSKAGVLGRHWRTTLGTSCCAGNADHPDGPPTYVALESTFREILEPGEYERLVDAAMSGRRGAMTLRVRPGVLEALAEDDRARDADTWPSYLAAVPVRIT